VTAQGTEGGDGLPLPTDQPVRGLLPGGIVHFSRRHAIFGTVLLAAAAVRVIAMLGFRGPMLYPDSTVYVAKAVRMAPGLVRPSGYSAMLWLLEPFHSLALVLGVQHAMGLGIGVAGYALLRRVGLPGWGATLAMVPVLLSAYAIQIEHFLVSDTLFAFLVMIAVAAMMWWRDPPVWACGLAGLLLAAATLVRSQGLPLLIVFLACLFIKFTGWRTIAGALVMCAASAIPLAGYAAWFDSAHGTFRLTASDGAYLYSGVTTFADCAKINPPPQERRLCLNVPVSEREWPGFYIWSSTSPLHAVPGGAFGKRADSLGTSFALRAIRAQPLDYLRLAGRSFWQSFLLEPSTHTGPIMQRVWAASQNGYMFPAAPRKLPTAPNAVRDFSRYDRSGPGMRVVQPYASWVFADQRYIVVSGPLLGVIVLVGLGGLIVAWRRVGGPALLPWLTGLVLLVTPAVIVEFDPRYVVCTIPPLCVAAAIGAAQIAGLAKRFHGARRAPRIA
jgi:hypothetical protein